MANFTFFQDHLMLRLTQYFSNADDKELAKTYVLRSLDLKHNYRSGVLYEAYFKEYKEMQEKVREMEKKGYEIPENLQKYLEMA